MSGLLQDARRCRLRGRHDPNFTNHSQPECPVQVTPQLQAQWDRFDEVQEIVLQTTSSTHFGAEPDEAGRLVVSMSLDEFQRLASYIGQLGRLRSILRELL